MRTRRDIGNRVMGAVHSWILRVSGGRLGARVGKARTLLLVTTGRKSGRQRTSPLFYITDDEDFVVTASNAGQDHPPGWYFNLQAEPAAVVEVEGNRIPVFATEVDKSGTDQMWDRLDAIYGGYAGYREQTTRDIPIIRLSPVKDDITS